MKLCRCPVCHSDIHLDALLEDDAGREILGIITNLRGDNARALVSLPYLDPRKRRYLTAVRLN